MLGVIMARRSLQEGSGIPKGEAQEAAAAIGWKANSCRGERRRQIALS
jgi:hypothetical protein